MQMLTRWPLICLDDVDDELGGDQLVEFVDVTAGCPCGTEHDWDWQCPHS